MEIAVAKSNRFAINVVKIGSERMYFRAKTGWDMQRCEIVVKSRNCEKGSSGPFRLENNILEGLSSNVTCKCMSIRSNEPSRGTFTDKRIGGVLLKSLESLHHLPQLLGNAMLFLFI